MSVRYCCANPNRVQEVGAQTLINGIEYIEVASEDQRTLDVFFVHPLPGNPDAVPTGIALDIARENFAVDGGVRTRNLSVTDVAPHPAAGNALRLTVSDRGDFSTYTLRFVSGPGATRPPRGFDPRLSTIDFSFKAQCPSEFDCKQEAVCPPEPADEPEIDYLAKDYAGFRRLILDRMSVIMPDWRERHAADLQIALVEALAYVGDHLSYYQDAVAGEAYLGTARSRISVRRHARLLDYRMHDGCNARVWIALEVDPDADGLALPGPADLQSDRRVFFFTRIPGQAVQSDAVPEEQLTAYGAAVFEPMHAVTLNHAHNRMEFYTWSDDDCCLPAGATEATLRNDDDAVSLMAGDFLVLEQEVIAPVEGEHAEQGADPSVRHVVRLETVTYEIDPLNDTPVVTIAWHQEDALPFPLPISPERHTGESGSVWRTQVVARGNIVLADHGRFVSGQALTPDAAGATGNYRPRLPDADVTWSVPVDPGTVSAVSNRTEVLYDSRPTSARRLLLQNPADAWPAIVLNAAGGAWFPRKDLLQSASSDTHFVVETERDRIARLRFGDEVNGNKPEPGTGFTASYRIGNGTWGNIGAESIAHVVLPDGIVPADSIRSVRNPLAAAGGTDPESMEQVRQYAPQAFRSQERAVTPDDYAAVTAKHYDVQKAAAAFRWTGSWYTVFVAVDRKGGRAVDAAFEEEIRALLERYRLAGFDVEIEAAQYVPLDIAMTICVKPGYFRSNVHKALLDAFSNKDLADGSRGFFHPDNFTFETPLYMSRLIEKAAGIAGVASVTVTTFQRWGKAAGDELADAVLRPGRNEIITLDNDRNFPENGKIEFTLEGGL